MCKCCSFFDRWCRRYAVHFTAVGAAFYTTASVYAARFLAVGVGVTLPVFLLLVPPFTLRLGLMLPVFRPLVLPAVDAAFYTTARVNAFRFSAVGVGVMLPILLLLVSPFTLRLG